MTRAWLRVLCWWNHVCFLHGPHNGYGCETCAALYVARREMRTTAKRKAYLARREELWQRISQR